jgi:hypothetical protein
VTINQPEPASNVTVMYAIVCAAPPALHIRTLIEKTLQRGWETCLILTPTAALWLEADLDAFRKITGYPVRSAYKLPGQGDVLPPPTALLVAPATANTINKWAQGISDNLALGLLTESFGKRLPVVALPYLNQAQAAHPAFAPNVETLRGAGAQILLGADGYTPHNFGESRPERFPWDVALNAIAKHADAPGPA